MMRYWKFPVEASIGSVYVKAATFSAALDALKDYDFGSYPPPIQRDGKDGSRVITEAWAPEPYDLNNDEAERVSREEFRKVERAEKRSVRVGNIYYGRRGA